MTDFAPFVTTATPIYPTSPASVNTAQNFAYEPLQTAGYDYPQAQAANYQMCNSNYHYFQCKHELTCYCGMTKRLTELELPRGI